MLILNPSTVAFGSATFDDVQSIAVQRSCAKVVEAWGDEGPYCTFADAPEVRVEIVVVQVVGESVAEPAQPGEQAELSAVFSPNLSQARRLRLTAAAIVKSVAYAVAPKGALRTTTFLAVSGEGKSPIALSDISNQA